MSKLHATYEITKEQLDAAVADPLAIKEHDLRARVQQMALERLPITVVREEGLQPGTVRLHVSAPDPKWLLAEVERLRPSERLLADLRTLTDWNRYLASDEDWFVAAARVRAASGEEA